MAEILFYHLEKMRLEQVLPGLLEKTLERGWQAVLRVSSQERVDQLDQHLWTYRDESFLPHSAAGDGATQPIWITQDDDLPNNPDILFLADGAKASKEELEGFQRCVTIFSGHDEGAVNEARAFWKEAKAGGFDVTYWKQSEQGKWEKQG